MSNNVLMSLVTQIEDKRNFIHRLNKSLVTLRDPHVIPKAEYGIPSENRGSMASSVKIDCNYLYVDSAVSELLHKARKELVQLCKEFKKAALNE